MDNTTYYQRNREKILNIAKDYYEKATITTVRIITPHFANCEVNCSYCDCEVVNHTKNKKQFPSPSSQKKFEFIWIRLFQIISIFFSSNVCYYQQKYCF